MKYRAEIDGLRTVAVLPVILFHAGFTIFSGGFVGVDVFFVISGYLITSIIYREMQAGNFSILRFYERRARRILPALFLVILVSLPFAWVWLPPGDMADFAQSLMAVATFCSNILFWRESGYFETAAELKPLLHTWSLAVEEQYYVLFPLFLMLCWRLPRTALLALLGAIALISLALGEYASINHPNAAFYLLPTRGWELLIGALCAVHLSGRDVPDATPIRSVLSGLGLAMIVYAVFAFDHHTRMPGLPAMLPTVGTALIILFATGTAPVARLLSLPVFVGIGLISYSAYLWHQPLFSLAWHQASAKPATWLMMILAALSLLLAYLSWKYIEAPFRDRARTSRRTIWLFSLAGTCVLLGLGLFGQTDKGLSSRFEIAYSGEIGPDDYLQSLAEAYIDCTPAELAEGGLRWRDYLSCKQMRPGTPDIVLLGDSHMEHLFLGLAETLPQHNIVYYTQNEKPYLDKPRFAAIFDHVLNNDVRQIVIFGMHYLGRPRDSKSELPDNFETAINALKNAGKHVVLMGDIPRYTTDPETCLYRRPGAPKDSLHPLCSMSPEDAARQKNSYEPDLIALATKLDITYIDPSTPLCTNAGCAMVAGHTILYLDSNHLNSQGSRLVGSHVARALAKDLTFLTNTQ